MAHGPEQEPQGFGSTSHTLATSFSVESEEHSALSPSDHDRRARFLLCSSSYVEFTSDGSTQSLPHSYQLENTWTSAKLYLKTDSLSTQWDWTSRKNAQKGPLPSTKSPGSFHPLSTFPSALQGLSVLQNTKLSTKHWRRVLITAVLVMVHFKEGSQPVWTSHCSWYSPLTAEEWRATTPSFHCYGGFCLFSHVKLQ